MVKKLNILKSKVLHKLTHKYAFDVFLEILVTTTFAFSTQTKSL